jgi:hypothetical protein
MGRGEWVEVIAGTPPVPRIDSHIVQKREEPDRKDSGSSTSRLSPTGSSFPNAASSFEYAKNVTP